MIGRRAALLGGMAGLAGCGSLPRLPAVPVGQTDQAVVLDLPNARFHGTPAGIAALGREAMAALARRGAVAQADLPPLNLLAVSGGSDSGAFGAGVLAGWTARGDRPAFDLVTGVSTGALIAPFAFLGSDHDATLRALYTGLSRQDVLRIRGLLAALTDDAVADTAPLADVIARHVNQALLDGIAGGYRQGRLLLIATTDLDAQLPVYWNLGAIAASGRAGALRLVQRLMLASSAVPGAFPPEMIDVSVNGRRYQEMHVDGGTVAQAFLYPAALGAIRRDLQRGRQRLRPVEAWVIRNGRLDGAWENVDRVAWSIAGRAIDTMIASSGVNDVLRIWFQTRQDGIGFHLADIRRDFTLPHTAMFDPAYMQALFAYGAAMGRRGDWADRPPGVEPVSTASP